MTDMQTNLPFEKQHVADSFSRAAKSYDDYSFIQREVGDRLIERMTLMNISPKTILDLGCGTGYYTKQLKDQFARAKVTGVDIAPGMIEQAKRRSRWYKKLNFQIADMDALPFDNNSIDFIFSNLTVQWSPNLIDTVRELHRVLAPKGLILFSTLGPDTLIELKNTWRQIDTNVHVNDFLDMHDVGDALVKNGFLDPVMDMEKLVFSYKTLKGMMQDLKGVGAHNINNGRPRGLMGKKRWQHFESLYPRTQDKAFGSTYEVIYGHAWGSEKKLKLNEANTYHVALE